ncbi:hypothetical protein RvY_15228 [Ramazzottius varieornatus]|uniref:Secreted protein n=1 Tax=Ramazzottius varieornatus TaxID=947166 RepID=A0A1D1VU78_RAMVA|nr:hypothetical protein RvY_15228 [Ramazzottius varieornatus]
MIRRYSSRSVLWMALLFVCLSYLPPNVAGHMTAVTMALPTLRTLFPPLRPFTSMLRNKRETKDKGGKGSKDKELKVAKSRLKERPRSVERPIHPSDQRG